MFIIQEINYMKKPVFALMLIVICWMKPAFGMDSDGLPKIPAKATKALTWDFLKEGDSIELIAPSKAVSGELVDAVKTLIKSNGLQAHLPVGAINPEASLYSYYANSDEKRAQHFMNALQGEAKALWALRGGFGAAEVVDIVERASFSLPAKPKLIVGFSDVTALFLLADRWGWPSLHAPVAALGKEFYSINKMDVNKEVNLSSVLKILKGEITQLEYKLDIICPGKIIEEPIWASVMGGTLSLIENHSGTKTALRGNNRFVFFEDTPDDGKRFKRRLMNLVRTGVFDKAKGIIVGKLPIVGFENSDQETKDLIRHFVQEYLVKQRGIDIPVVYSPRFGHGPYNDVLPLGTAASLTIHCGYTTLNVSVNEPVGFEQ